MDIPRVTWAQNGEDIVLLRAFAGMDRGTYIDVGANLPDFGSITKAFYDRGWRGLLVEASPAFAEQLRKDRPGDIVEEVAASAEPGTLTLHEIADTGLSTTKEDIGAHHARDGREVVERKVPAVPVSQLIDRHGLTEIHFMTVDVEGAEADVIAGLDLERHRPWVLVVEATYPNSIEQTHGTWEPVLTAAGYRFCQFDGLSRFYVAEEHADLAEALSIPASPAEGFLRADDIARHDQIVALSSDVEETREQVEEWRMRYEQAARALTDANRVIAEQRERLAALRARVQRLRRRLDRARSTITAMEQSRSWRLTRPLRRLRQR